MFGTASVYEDMQTLNQENGLCEVEADEEDMAELVRKLKAFGLRDASRNIEIAKQKHTEFKPHCEP